MTATISSAYIWRRQLKKAAVWLGTSIRRMANAIGVGMRGSRLLNGSMWARWVFLRRYLLLLLLLCLFLLCTVRSAATASTYDVARDDSVGSNTPIDTSGVLIGQGAGGIDSTENRAITAHENGVQRRVAAQMQNNNLENGMM